MDGLDFVTATLPAAIHPARADVACFIGFVARRPVRPRGAGESDESLLGRLPAAMRSWFDEHDWAPARSGRTVEELVELMDVPVPVDSWEAFDALFAWNDRRIDDAPDTPGCDTALGAAVRSFFAQGGRLCYVVRLGDPWPVRAPVAVRRAQAIAYLPVFPPVSTVDRTSWRGLGHLFGLPGISYLCLPDLPDLFSVSPPLREPITPPEGPEAFIECAARLAPAEQRFLRGVPPPQCDEDGYRAWRQCVAQIGEFVAYPPHRLREIQFVATVPLPVDAAAVASEFDAADRVHRAAQAQWNEVAQIQSAFVQLVYPWLRTRDASLLPGNILAPDGWFTGLLARNALDRGAWRALIHQAAGAVTAVEPVLDRATLARPLGVGAATVREHVSIVGPTAGGMVVLSDVTTDDDPTYRAASVNRLVVAILRAARVAGDDFVFGNNGEAIWQRLRENLENLLAGLWADGALLGASAPEAFEVRCDRSTMTQADIDAGRLLARISFTASQPIVHLTVVLAMDDAGQVTLVAPIAASSPEVA